MTNKEAIEYLKEAQSHIDLENGGNTQKVYDAIDMAIKALEEQERPTLRHVIINHPRYGGSDGWYDEARQILFQNWVTIEYAKTLGWSIKEEAEDEQV